MPASEEPEEVRIIDSGPRSDAEERPLNVELGIEGARGGDIHVRRRNKLEYIYRLGDRKQKKLTAVVGSVDFSAIKQARF